MRRSCDPGMRYPLSLPESNHLLTVRGATLQIFATWPVVNTFITRLHFVFVSELILASSLLAMSIETRPPDAECLSVWPRRHFPTGAVKAKRRQAKAFRLTNRRLSSSVW